MKEDMQNPKLSIIIPVYNVEKYIRECLDSILNQSFQCFEVLLINDGSWDRSGTICDEYTEKDSRFKVFHKENGGVSSARNLGLDNAKGEWINFIDPDDYLLSNDMYEKIFQNNLEDIQMIRFGFVVGGENLKARKNIAFPQGVLKKEYILENFAKQIQNFLFCWVVLFKRGLIEEDRFILGMRICEDATFLSSIFFKTDKVLVLSDLYYFYRKNEGSVTKKYLEDPFQYALIFLNQIKDLYIKSNRYNVKEYNDFMVNFFLYPLSYETLNPDRRKSIETIEKYTEEFQLKDSISLKKAINPKGNGFFFLCVKMNCIGLGFLLFKSYLKMKNILGF